MTERSAIIDVNWEDEMVIHHFWYTEVQKFSLGPSVTKAREERWKIGQRVREKGEKKLPKGAD